MTSTSPPVSMISAGLVHSQYAAQQPLWHLVRTIIAGKYALEKAGETYLVRPPGRSDTEYNFYLRRANFVNFTAKTLDGYQGSIYRKKPIVKLPKQIEYLEDNADGRGTPLKDLSKSTSSEVFQMGRYGLLAEYPRAEHFENLDQERKANTQAYIKPYQTEDILDWRTRLIGSQEVLESITLRETFLRDNDDFLGIETDFQYRVLKLNSDGEYLQEIYREEIVDSPKEDKQGGTINVFRKGESISHVSHSTSKRTGQDQNTKIVLIDTIFPKLPGGIPFTFIPFQFVGPESLTWMMDKPPLYDMAVVNLAHYVNEADISETNYYVSGPILTFTGLDEEFIEANKGMVKVGSKSAYLLPEGADAKFIQYNADTNGLFKNRKDLEAQMLAIGAKVVQNNQNTGSESQESVRNRSSGDANLTANISANVSEAITRVLGWCALWMGTTPDEIKFSLNSDFQAGRLSAQELKELRESTLAGLIPMDVFFSTLRKGEIIDEIITNQELREMLEEDGLLPSGGSPDIPELDAMVTNVQEDSTEATSE